MKLIHYLPVIATLLITGCATTQEPKLYILNSPSVSAETGTASDPLSLFIAPIQLPGYLDRLSIVTQSGDNEIVYSEFPRWAEPLDTSLRQKLADNLSKMVQSDRIFSDGRHPPKGTDFRIDLSLIQLTGTLGKTAQLEARWMIRSEAGELVKIGSFNQSAVLADSTYLSYVQAQSQLLTDLNRAIADSIPKKLIP